MIWPLVRKALFRCLSRSAWISGEPNTVHKPSRGLGSALAAKSRLTLNAIYFQAVLNVEHRIRNVESRSGVRIPSDFEIPCSKFDIDFDPETTK
jgi:hypothetical protein